MNTEKRCSNAQEFFNSRLQYLREMSRRRPFWTMHLLPFDHESSPLSLDSVTIRTSVSGLLVTEGRIHGRQCQDGFIVSENSGDRQCRHVLAFPDGKVEFFNTAYPGEATDKKDFPWKRVFPDMCESVDRLQKVVDGLFTLPMDMHLALVDYQGYTIPFDIQLPSDSGQPISKDTIAKSLGAIDTEMASEVLLKPFFDRVFVESGQKRCPAYSEDGKFLSFKL